MRKRKEHDELNRPVADPAAHPALLLIGLAERETAALAESEIASWRNAPDLTGGHPR
jgi:hypothetical protein